MKCKKCGNEVDKKAVICTNCGCKISKPIYKKPWLWVLIVIVFVAVAASSGSEEATLETNENTVSNVTEEIVYEVVDLQTMFDELDNNAMKAENNYQNKYIEFQCKICNFDSDGQYISVEPVNASEWNFSSAMCYIKNDAQKNFLMEKNVGDSITVKGKIKSIGEVMGYSIDIMEVY